MNIVKDVKEILKLQSHHEKRSQLEQLSDVFEYGHELSKEKIAAGVQLLLAAVLQEEGELPLS